MIVSSRIEAKDNGSKFFFTGVLCVNNHKAERFTSDGKCAECVRSHDRARYLRRRDSKRAYDKAYYQENKETIIESARQWSNNNQDKRCEISSKYYSENKEKHCALTSFNMRKKKWSKPNWLTKEDNLKIHSFYVESKRLTDLTGKKHHVDHIIPLNGKRVSGLHVPWNLQVITAKENLRKSNKFE